MIDEMIIKTLINKKIYPTTRELVNCVYAIISFQIACTHNSTHELVAYLYGQDDTVVLYGG